jgi:holin-like protein
MRGLAILFGFQLLGTAIAEWLHLLLPGNVLGLILFLIALFAGWVKVEWVEQTSAFLLKHMMLFFTPFIVGTIAFLPLLSREWAPILLTLTLGTSATLIAAGVSAKLWIRTEAAAGERRNQEKNRHGG